MKMKMPLVKAGSNSGLCHTNTATSEQKISTEFQWLPIVALLLAGAGIVLGQEIPVPAAPAPIPVDPILVVPVAPPPAAPIAPAPAPIDPTPAAPAPVPGPIDGGTIGGFPGGVRNFSGGGNTNRTNPREIARANAPAPTNAIVAPRRPQVVQQVERISLRGTRPGGTNNVGGGTNNAVRAERMNPRLFARQNAPAQATNAVSSLPMQRVPQQAQRLNLRVRTPLGGGAAGGVAAGNGAPPPPPPIDPNVPPPGG